MTMHHVGCALVLVRPVKAISKLEAPKLDNMTCMICWDTAEYGLSTVCAHFYCSGCIKMTLKTALEMGQVPFIVLLAKQNTQVRR